MPTHHHHCFSSYHFPPHAECKTGYPPPDAAVHLPPSFCARPVLRVSSFSYCICLDPHRRFSMNIHHHLYCCCHHPPYHHHPLPSLLRDGSPYPNPIHPVQGQRVELSY